MKSFVMLVLFICLCSLYALTAPTNVRAAAIGHDAFTLRWDAVAGATGYEVEVKEDIEQFFVDFEEPSSLDGWSVNNAERFYSTTVTAGYNSHGLLKLMPSSSYAITPVLSNPQSVSFWIRRTSSTTANITVNIEYSSNSNDWQSVGVLTVHSGSGNPTTTYQQFSYDLNLIGNYWIRFRYTTTSTCNIMVDNIMVQERGQEVAEANLDYHATRVSGLSPNTDYLYRVRATADLQAGPFSEWQSITTLAEAPATAANGSAINSIPVTITLPQIGTYPQQSIEIAPNIGDGDFLVAVDEPAANTISYSITAADGELPGSYIIHHPGFTASNLEVLSAEYDAVTLANGSSSLSITSFTGKGTLQILLTGIPPKNRMWITIKHCAA